MTARLDRAHRPSADDGRWRRAKALREAWPYGAAGRALLVLLILGVALRLLTMISLRPTTILEDSYQNYALTNPFRDPLHPAGYALILAAIGAVTHNITATVLIQHLSGLASALLLGAATRRITGSAWAGLLPAGLVLLSGDEIFLEHSIMSESWEVLATSFGLYAGVRTLDEPEPWTRWPLLTGATLAAAGIIRSANLLLIPLAVFALLLGPPGVLKQWRRHWRGPIATIGAAAIVLLAFAGANATFGTRFGITPSPGWYLYGRVAQFADCTRFTPPPGTAGLCQNTPPSQRPSTYWYILEGPSPAVRLFGSIDHHDRLLRAWAERALRAQLGDFLATGWAYLRSYYVPSSLPARLKGSSGLDPQLDFTYLGTVLVPEGIQAEEAFFGPFSIHRVHWGLQMLRDWQLVVRFGGTALFVTTILSLIGLAIGTRRSRFGVLLFGGGGFSLIVVAAFGASYVGRYTVPAAGLLMTAAAITLTELWRTLGRWRSNRKRIR